MDATFKRFWALCALCLVTTAVHGATFKTANFVVNASSDDLARRVANCAEYWRRDLAIQWLGQPLPNWYQPCPITVQAGQMGAGGQTTFTFENGEVYGWKMQVQGTVERILDSVIPHEVNHTIFASYFRRPLPRWADEGAATLFEHESEQAHQTQRLNRVLNTAKRIPLQELLTIREYPPDMQDVLTLYAEGYSLAGFLVGSKGEQGRQVYIRFLEDAHQMGWEQAIERHYGFASVAHLEQQWTRWIVAGSPPLQPVGQALAQAETPRTDAQRGTEPQNGTGTGTLTAAGASAPQTQIASAAADRDLVIRSQSPSANETIPALTAIDRAPAALPGIPRQLRTARPHEVNQTSITPQTMPPMQTASAASAYPRTEDFHPRALRQTGTQAASVAPRLSPTTDGIATDPHAKYYSFPEARR